MKYGATTKVLQDFCDSQWLREYLIHFVVLKFVCKIHPHGALLTKSTVLDSQKNIHLLLQLSGLFFLKRTMLSWSSQQLLSPARVW